MPENEINESKCGIIDILRKPKFFDMSIFDWATSLLGAWIIGAYVFGLRGGLVWSVYLLMWVALGVLVHCMLGIPTMFGYYVGVSEKPHRKTSC